MHGYVITGTHYHKTVMITSIMAETLIQYLIFKLMNSATCIYLMFVILITIHSALKHPECINNVVSIVQHTVYRRLPPPIVMPRQSINPYCDTR